MTTEQKAKSLLRWAIPMWVCNLIAFVSCLLLENYAEYNRLWYEDAFAVLAVSFGTTKLVLSVLVILGLCAYSSDKTVKDTLGL